MSTNNASTVVATLPSNSLDLIGRSGSIGTRYFMGTKSAKEVKEVGKGLGLKGRALGNYVNKALRDESANRAVVVAGTVAELHNRGFVAESVDLKKKTAVIRFLKPADKAKTEAAKVAKEASNEIERLKGELAAALELLNAKN